MRPGQGAQLAGGSTPQAPFSAASATGAETGAAFPVARMKSGEVWRLKKRSRIASGLQKMLSLGLGQQRCRSR
ncbi:hypothetical protein D3C84_993710 [compost metagenome]